VIAINADDWGRSRAETDAASSCWAAGRITSVSAVVFMDDSERAAALANDVGMRVGLHLNLSQRFTAGPSPALLVDCHDRVAAFLAMHKYARLLYNPFLRKQFRYVYEAQVEEFIRLYERHPAHIDGHRHLHLCANVVLGNVLPEGMLVRRNFSFRSGEKGLANRLYRSLLDRRLARRCRLNDYFFALSWCLQTNCLSRVSELAKISSVELMTHPIEERESRYLMDDRCMDMFPDLRKVH
jgi:chitin disaccharide deacetylase